MPILVMLNNFAHDFSAAGWLFCAVLLWIARRRLPAAGAWSADTRFLVKRIRRLMPWCLAGIVVFGVVRALAYREFEWNEAAGRAQITVLAVKHVLLTVVFLAGLSEFVRAGRRMRSDANETE